MSASIMSNDRIVELLVQRATEGLNASEQAELNDLLANGNYTDADQFETTAAALTLAALDDEPLPASLRSRLLQQADAFVTTASVSSVTTLQPKLRNERSGSRVSKLAWFAAAASAVLAVAGWWPRLQMRDNPQIDVFAQASADVETIAKARERLIAQGELLQRDWKPTEDPASRGVTGDIVWDEKAQVGYMRFRGLPKNNPEELQYQLWIFDATRGDQYPVDGGVFDIPQTDTGDVVVPILAKLPVRNPALFAVTIEKPGGSVVSSRERIVLIAPVAQG
jgi:hypothetical protein